MKTTKEMIEVMKAFDEGKEIEYRYADRSYKDDWEPCPNEKLFDWVVFDYRVKPGEKFRPYKDTEEMFDDYCERFHVTRTDYGEPFIWIKSKCGIKYLISAIAESHIWTVNATNNMDELLELFTYKDGSPCGKEVEE